MPADKVYPTCSEAVADIPDGARIMLGGFTTMGGMANELILALRDQGAQELTIIINSLAMSVASTKKGLPPPPGTITDLVENGQVRRGIASFGVSPSPSRPTAFEKLFLEGKAEVEVVPQGTLCERMRIAAAGLGGFYTRVGVGTAIEEGKEKREFDGEEYILEEPLRADYALLRAHKADKMGNLVYRGTSRNFNPLMAAAANTTIVQVHQIVEVGELDPEEIITPGVYINRIVPVPREWPPKENKQ